MRSWITLNDLRFHARHGVLEQERACGNTFTLNLRMEVDITRAAQTDDVAHTVNYAEVCEAVSDEMATPSRLLEHVALRVARRLLRQFPQIQSLRLSIEKHNPPMNADIRSAGVEIECDREDLF